MQLMGYIVQPSLIVLIIGCSVEEPINISQYRRSIFEKISRNYLLNVKWGYLENKRNMCKVQVLYCFMG